jgi:hypothetical protein
MYSNHDSNYCSHQRRKERKKKATRNDLGKRKKQTELCKKKGEAEEKTYNSGCVLNFVAFSPTSHLRTHWGRLNGEGSPFK